MNAHTALCNRILAAVSRTASRVFLSPVGAGVTGRIERVNQAGPVHLQPGDYVVRFGQRIEYGLTPGSGDIIGITPHVVTAEDVGRTLGIFTSLEVKTGTGRLQPHQRQWIDVIRSLGGIAEEVRAEAEALNAMRVAGPSPAAETPAVAA